MLPWLYKILFKKTWKILCSGGGCQDKIFCLFCHKQNFFTQKYKQELNNFTPVITHTYFQIFIFIVFDGIYSMQLRKRR